MKKEAVATTIIMSTAIADPKALTPLSDDPPPESPDPSPTPCDSPLEDPDYDESREPWRTE